MALLTPILERTNVTEVEDSPSADRSSRAGLARKALAALVAGAAAYLVVRRVRDLRPSVDDIPEIVDEATPIDGETIPIGEPDGESEDAGDVIDEATERIDDATERIDGDETEGGSAANDLADADAIQDEARSAEEITERAEENVQAEPAEPGEMTVDEDVADDLVDDAEDDEE